VYLSLFGGLLVSTTYIIYFRPMLNGMLNFTQVLTSKDLFGPHCEQQICPILILIWYSQILTIQVGPYLRGQWWFIKSWKCGIFFEPFLKLSDQISNMIVLLLHPWPLAENLYKETSLTSIWIFKKLYIEKLVQNKNNECIISRVREVSKNLDMIFCSFP